MFRAKKTGTTIGAERAEARQKDLRRWQAKFYADLPAISQPGASWRPAQRSRFMTPRHYERQVSTPAIEAQRRKVSSRLLKHITP